MPEPVGMAPAGAALRDLSPRWLSLLLIIRLSAVGAALALLAAHRVTDYDQTLALVVVGYTVLVVPIVWRWPGLLMRPSLWFLDAGLVLGLVIASGDWRSPFYLLALTSLATPAAAMRPSRGLALGFVYTIVYAVVARIIGPDPLTLGAQTTVETLATHLLLPVLLAFGVAYAAEAVRRLGRERERSQRMAIEAERRRIGWELHDSAKQRVHAAHLVLGSVETAGERSARALEQALEELRAAAGDMDTAVAELRSPLEGRPLHVALRERAQQLRVEGGPEITVHGEIEDLQTLQAAHAYRIAAEALTNAVRHAAPTRVDVRLAQEGDELCVLVADDGCGMPEVPRPGSNGLRAMGNRATTIGGTLEVLPRTDGAGTCVELRFPRDPRSQES